jgi:hypothetical protein
MVQSTSDDAILEILLMIQRGNIVVQVIIQNVVAIKRRLVQSSGVGDLEVKDEW